MARLVDADELLGKFRYGDYDSRDDKDWIMTVRRMIKEQPTIEAEPVKHGKWEEYEVPHIICCSECDWATGVDEKDFNYCPNCGARMDGE